MSHHPIRLKISAAVLCALGILALFTSSKNAWVSADEVSKSSTFTALNYLTGWAHDSRGYHPAVFMLLENNSNRDLSNRSIKFQARFTDLNTAEVTIGRQEVRRDLKPHQQFSLMIEGAEGYELPLEAHLWPSIEAKVMCRTGTADDEGTETILISKLEAVARTEEDAFHEMNQATSYNPSRHHNTSTVADRPTRQPTGYSGQKELVFEKRPYPEKPLLATAGHLDHHDLTAPNPVKLQRKNNSTAPLTSTSTMSLLNSRSLPGLGDDFYVFEQRYGLPVATDAAHSDWTWAKYRHAPSATEIVTGSRERSGKVDLILIKVPRSQAPDGMTIVNAARQLPARQKPSLPAPTRSVRYLPSGRLELVASVTPSYKVVCLTSQNAQESDNSFILVMSRLSQDVEPMLAGLSRKSALLTFIRFLDGTGSESTH